MTSSDDQELKGTLKGDFNRRGFTFVSSDPSSGLIDDVFLHISALDTSDNAARYVRGARVAFQVQTVFRDGVEKTQARAVRLLDEQPNLVESEVVAAGLTGRVKFWSPLGYGFLVDESGSKEYYARSASVEGGYLRDGDVVEFDVETASQGEQAVNVRIRSWEPLGDAFLDHVDLGHPSWARRLAEMAEPENWNYQERPSKDAYTILRSYLKYTFYRLHELDNHLRVSNDGNTMAFNTGLVTSYQEEIFAVCNRQAGVGPEWRLVGFEKASSPSLMGQFGASLPPLAWYYDSPGQLIFDLDIPLTVNVEHVPHDPDRFPKSLADLSPQDLAGLVNAKAPEAIDRVRRNYKTAIPQFYRSRDTREGRMQLLLPVALLRRNSIELALAVDRLDSGVYLGRTVLTLDWAYNNARLLTRPDSDWLRP